MPTFRFTAAAQNGKISDGVLEASSEAIVKGEVRAKGLTLLSIQEVASKRSTLENPLSNFLNPSQKLPLKSLALISRQLATLLTARLRIDEALLAVASALKPRPAAILLDVRVQVQEGKTLAQAMRSFPTSFPELYIESIAAGESSGDLGKVMEQLAQHYENRVQNAQTVQLALIYPCLLAVVSFSIIIVLMVFVVPDIVRVFTDRGSELPLLTIMLITSSDFLAAWGLWLLIFSILFIAGFLRWKKNPQNFLRFHKFIALARPSRKLSQATNGAQLCSILSTLLTSGVPLVDALNVAATTLPNRFFRFHAEQAADQVKKGDSFSKAVRDAGVFSPLLVAMISSGESSGRLAQTLEHSAKEQQRSLEALVKTVVGLVEPIILLLMGGIVMLMVLAILLPIISMNTASGL